MVPVATAIAAPLAWSRRWRSARSATIPAGNPTRSRGAIRIPSAAPTITGELVSSSVSQPRTTCSPTVPTELPTTERASARKGTVRSRESRMNCMSGRPDARMLRSGAARRNRRLFPGPRPQQIKDAGPSRREAYAAYVERRRGPRTPRCDGYRPGSRGIMTAVEQLDLLITNARIVRPHREAVERLDLGVKDGRFVRIAPTIPTTDAAQVYDADGLLAFPGVVDAHTHVGIYAPLADDAVTESKAAASGGVTTMLNYIRTGQYYLDRGGPYAEFLPEALARSAGRYWVDYGYHVAPIERAHIGEMERLATRDGVPSFKIFMFYGGYGLHGQTDWATQRRFLRLGETDRYDLAHFEFVMRGAAAIQQRHPAVSEHVSVSLHCEIADILN